MLDPGESYIECPELWCAARPPRAPDGCDRSADFGVKVDQHGDDSCCEVAGGRRPSLRWSPGRSHRGSGPRRTEIVTVARNGSACRAVY